MLVNLRPAGDQDKEFCRGVHHAAYRGVILRQFGHWDEHLQDDFFEKEWASLRLQIIEVDGQAAGCFGRQLNDEGISIEQIALLPQFQEQGMGTLLLTQQTEQAQSLGVPVRLQVLRENRARHLYERLGFAVTSETATHFLMERLAGKSKQRNASATDG